MNTNTNANMTTINAKRIAPIAYKIACDMNNLQIKGKNYVCVPRGNTLGHKLITRQRIALQIISKLKACKECNINVRILKRRRELVHEICRLRDLENELDELNETCKIIEEKQVTILKSWKSNMTKIPQEADIFGAKGREQVAIIVAVDNLDYLARKGDINEKTYMKRMHALQQDEAKFEDMKSVLLKSNFVKSNY